MSSWPVRSKQSLSWRKAPAAITSDNSVFLCAERDEKPISTDFRSAKIVSNFCRTNAVFVKKTPVRTSCAASLTSRAACPRVEKRFGIFAKKIEKYFNLAKINLFL